MIDVDTLYFKWLMEVELDDASPALQRLCWMLHQNVFQRRVGHDVNRAVDGVNLRRAFVDAHLEAEIAPSVTNDLMEIECSWLEMLIAMAKHMDYYYDGGVQSRFIELARNLDLLIVIMDPSTPAYSAAWAIDQMHVDTVTSRVDASRFESNGQGGLFPLSGANQHPDQREVEIWEQHAAYFRERLEGVVWTSTS